MVSRAFLDKIRSTILSFSIERAYCSDIHGGNLYFFISMSFRPLLVIAHPGHELRIWHWVTLNKPLTFILTDGGGANGEARLEESAQLLSQAGCERGTWFGAFADTDVYEMLLKKDGARLAPLVLQLQQAMAASFPAIVIGDMCEGYNPSHDVCRAMIGAACELAAAQGSAPEQNLAFPLIGDPMKAWTGRLTPVTTLTLDEAALNEKMAAAQGYEQLRRELETALASSGRQAYAQEAFYTPLQERGLDILPEEPPFYESYGAKQVSLGKYKDLISYQEHVLPSINSMRKALGLEA